MHQSEIGDIGPFVENVQAFFDMLDINEDSVFLLNEGARYEELEEIKKTIAKPNDQFELWPSFTFVVNDKNFRAFIKPQDEEAQIIGRLISPRCQEIVKKFREYR